MSEDDGDYDDCGDCGDAVDMCMSDLAEVEAERDKLREQLERAEKCLAEALDLAKLARRTVRDRLGDMHNARVASCLEQACPCPCHHAGEV